MRYDCKCYHTMDACIIHTNASTKHAKYTRMQCEYAQVPSYYNGREIRAIFAHVQTRDWHWTKAHRLRARCSRLRQRNSQFVVDWGCIHHISQNNYSVLPAVWCRRRQCKLMIYTWRVQNLAYIHTFLLLPSTKEGDSEHMTMKLLATIQTNSWNRKQCEQTWISTILHIQMPFILKMTLYITPELHSSDHTLHSHFRQSIFGIEPPSLTHESVGFLPIFHAPVGKTLRYNNFDNVRGCMML